MNYIEQAYKGLHDGWRYVIGVVMIIIAWQIIGVIPLLGFLIYEIVVNKAQLTTDISQMAGLLGKNVFLFLALLMFAVGLLGVFFVTKFLHKLPLKYLTTTRLKTDWSRFWFVFILWALFSIGSTVLAYALNPEDFVVQFDLIPFLILCLIVVIFIPLQTSFEEYFLRGYLMQGIGIAVKNRWVPLLITSVVFGLLHGFNPEMDALGPIVMVFYIGTGLLLGIMTLMDEGLELALGFHAANNMFIALLVTSDWSALQTHAVLKDITAPDTMAMAEIIIPVFVVFPILLFILAKKYKWTNWKEKLFGKINKPPKEDYKIIE